jgi:hypothetical protein
MTTHKDAPKTEAKANVVSLSNFRQKKTTDEELARGRKPLYVSHMTGKISDKESGESEQDFGDRLGRIKASLEKINKLMAELKKMSAGEQDATVQKFESRK